MNEASNKNIYVGMGLAALAAFIWSGNFIVAKYVNKQIAPISLNFYRWLIASVVILPFAFKKLYAERMFIRQSWHYLFWVALTGVSLFNTFVYVGAHYTTAINLAVIGTTTSPILSIIFARIFLKERIGIMKLIGILFCLAGVLFLLSKGNLNNLWHLHFGEGDLWVLLAALSFAVYNTLVKKKPATISPVSFLAVAFIAGTVLVLPFFIWEQTYSAPVAWNGRLILTVLYLGLAASVFCFMIWNIAIRKLGAGKTALFGNLIPVFSSLEAVLILHEDFTSIHIISMVMVFIGIVLANIQLKN